MNVVERVGEVASDSETVYVLGDNVGSASMTLRPDGTVVANARYLPFGEERWNEVDMPNDRGYTGQRLEKGFGLMDYNARYYSTLLGRFISPDTIVPNPASAESFDRYAYVSNNPIMNNDPSGHIAPAIALAIAMGAGAIGGYRRPFVVVQNNLFNQSRIHTVVVCALTTNLQRAKAPGNVLLEPGEGGLSKASVVNVSQLFTVDKNNLDEYCGSISSRRINQIIEGINLLLQPAEVD